MRKTLFIISACFILQSCNTNNNINVSTLNLKDAINVKPEIIKTEKLLSEIWSIRILDTMLVLFSDDGNGCLQIFSKSSYKHLKTKGIYGNGPGEFSGGNVDFKCIDDSIYIFDISKNTLLIYDINHFLNDSTAANNISIRFDKHKSNFDVIPLKKHFVSRPTSDSRFALFNRNGQFISDYFLFPDYFMAGDEPNLDFERRRYIHLDSKPDMSQFVSVSYIGGTIEIYNIHNDTINKLLEKNYLDPNLKNLGKSKSFNQLDSKIGFCGLSATNNFIYASFCGLTSKQMRNKLLADYIVVFNWKGNPQKIYKVEGGLTGLAVDESNQSIYIITRDSEGNSVIGLIRI